MAASSREARRRRILERGSDRLAFISGRIQTLPSSPPPPVAESHLSGQPSITNDYDQPSDSQVSDDKSSSSLLPQRESASESVDIKASDSEIRAQPVLSKCETGIEDLRPPSSEDNSRAGSSQDLSEVLDSSVSPPASEHPQTRHSKFLAPKQISSAITASEIIRVYCSIGVAILAVLSNIGTPMLGSDFIKSIIFFRPLYLVLLTDVSVVLAWIMLDKQRGLERIACKTNLIPSIGGDGLAEQFSKLFEWGFLVKSVTAAVFIDCSIYAILVICGLSIARKLGW